VQNGFLENAGKSVLFFAHIPETDSPEWQTGAVAVPDWGWIPEGPGASVSDGIGVPLLDIAYVEDFFAKSG
jgi:hypothetical protein